MSKFLGESFRAWKTAFKALENEPFCFQCRVDEAENKPREIVELMTRDIIYMYTCHCDFDLLSTVKKLVPT